jgi:hypothetical protein
MPSARTEPHRVKRATRPGVRTKGDRTLRHVAGQPTVLRRAVRGCGYRVTGVGSGRGILRAYVAGGGS